MEVKNQNLDKIFNRKDVREAIKSETPIIISGKQSTKGKTSLKQKLLEKGAVAYELWECLEIKLTD